VDLVAEAVAAFREEPQWTISKENAMTPIGIRIFFMTVGLKSQCMKKRNALLDFQQAIPYPYLLKASGF
jgi:hypothetical protein